MFSPLFRSPNRARRRLSQAAPAVLPPVPLQDRVTVSRAYLYEDVSEDLFWHWSWVLAPVLTIDLEEYR